MVAGWPLPGYDGLQFGSPAGAMLRRLWTRRRPDVIYVATEGPLGWSAVNAARRLAIPAFSQFHTNFHNYLRYYRLGFLRNPALVYLRCFHNRTNGTVVATADLRDQLLALGFQNVSCENRGVDSQLFDPARRSSALRARWGVSDGDLVVAHVGRIAGEKNLGLAIEAYRAMKQIAGSLRFMIVGDGPLRRELQTKHPDLIFCGLQTGERLAEHFASADIFLFPSETETFGNVVLEAMACGLAVVAYDCAAAKSHIADGETGMLAPLGDSKAFIAAALAMIREPSLLLNIRKNAREYSTTLDPARQIEGFECLFSGNAARSETVIKRLIEPQKVVTTR